MSLATLTVPLRKNSKTSLTGTGKHVSAILFVPIGTVIAAALVVKKSDMIFYILSYSSSYMIAVS